MKKKIEDFINFRNAAYLGIGSMYILFIVILIVYTGRVAIRTISNNAYWLGFGAAIAIGLSGLCFNKAFKIMEGIDKNEK